MNLTKKRGRGGEGEGGGGGRGLSVGGVVGGGKGRGGGGGGGGKQTLSFEELAPFNFPLARRSIRKGREGPKAIS